MRAKREKTVSMANTVIIRKDWSVLNNCHSMARLYSSTQSELIQNMDSMIADSNETRNAMAKMESISFPVRALRDSRNVNIPFQLMQGSVERLQSFVKTATTGSHHASPII